MVDARRALVVGAGIFGLASALALQRNGVPTVLIDLAPAGLNASAVAAGLIAPIGEALFDPGVAEHYSFLVAAAAVWQNWAIGSGIQVVDDGLIVAGNRLDELAVLRVHTYRAGDRYVARGDWRVIDPPAALATLRHAFLMAGGRIEARLLRDNDPAGDVILVLAPGPGSAALVARAPELDRLIPVKGQIAVLPHGPRAGPTVRWNGGYFAPQAGGARVGATMEVGISDLCVEEPVIQRLMAQASDQVPGLDLRDAYGQAGVRMQTPDYLPLVGPSLTPGVFVAAGARRNGWLLGPLVGEMIAAYVVGNDPGPWAALLHPGRFD